MRNKSNLLQKAKQVLNAGDTPDELVSEIKNAEKKEETKNKKFKYVT